MVTAYHMRVSALQDSCMRFYIPCFSAATEKNNFNSNILLRKILVILVFKKLNMNKKKKQINIIFQGKMDLMSPSLIQPLKNLSRPTS